MPTRERRARSPGPAISLSRITRSHGTCGASDSLVESVVSSVLWCQPVGGLEAGSTDLTFEDAELVAEGEHLDLERGVGLPAEDQEVEQGADDRVEETQDHGSGS